MVAWISKVQEGDFLGGISAMNDMLEMYPHDKHLFYLAGNWLMGENGPDQAQRMMEKALAIDKNFPPALNDLAYAEARNRRFVTAFAAMDRGIPCALSRCAQDRSGFRDLAGRSGRHLRSHGQSGAGPY
jgi:hypothetical protein